MSLYKVIGNPIPYGRQNITEEDISSVVETLRSDFLTQGPKVELFERQFSEYVGSEYAVAVSNGTAALHLSAMALNVNNESKVITSPLTFAASANSVIYCGGEISFVDVDPETGLMDLNELESKLSRNNTQTAYSGVIPVDYAGYPVNLEKVKGIADHYSLFVLEDSCHAPGAYFKDSNQQVHKSGGGTYSDLSIFSFHPVKHIATGEGGMITTNNKSLYERIKRLRTHGITKDPESLLNNDGGWYYEMQELGYNYRLSDLQCALGVSQLTRAEKNLARREEIASKYDETLKKLPISLPAKPENGRHAYHLYVIRTDRRKDLYDFLRSKQIFTQVHYVPVHVHPFYKKLGWKYGDFPKAENFYESCLSLPMYPSLSQEQQDYVIEMIYQFFN
ncbi:MAG: UDP-4-amino-4,6-dideoxy-N-acetyl-beta-L-altrosamine transaminase [Bacteroidota bacterium]